MESTENNLKALSHFHRYYFNDDTSSATSSFGTNASGTAVVPVIASESPDIEKSVLSWEGIKWKPQKERDFPSLTKFHSVYIHSQVKGEEALGSLHTDIAQARLSLQFSDEVENLIIYNSLFRRFISQIEKSLNIFIKYEKMSMKNTIFFEEDWEIPNYEKLVLSLDFLGIPFNKEMILWKEINHLVYGRIESMILNSSEEDTRRIKVLKRKFFIKLKM